MRTSGKKVNTGHLGTSGGRCWLAAIIRAKNKYEDDAVAAVCCCRMWARLMLKWVALEVRRGSGFGFVSESCEMDGAGGVECFLRAADGQPGEQDSVFVTVAGG